MRNLDPIDLSTAEALIDFGGSDAVTPALARQQLEGAVTLHNMLARHGHAYLADEVGMGKTYIALGVVAMMRRFKSDLRVLYLLPKNNVRDKWHKDYHSFVQANYRHHDGIVKGFGHQPAAPYRNCESLADLFTAVATDSVRDYFICTSAFSLALGNNKEDLGRSLDEFARRLPQYGPQVAEMRNALARMPATFESIRDFKRALKERWAGALHGMLPRFDLVLVDEAHNYRRGVGSSDRNGLLAQVLENRLDRLLLLSATPFEHELGELERQLALFGKRPDLALPRDWEWVDVHRLLAPFMVRRLNSLTLDGKPHTRNLYRDEHRSGVKAEVTLGIEQQLFAAVLQKKVGEAVNDGHHGKFELGMLASFESYHPGQDRQHERFDGDEDGAGAGAPDAADRGVVDFMVSDFRETFRRFPPHPKMDQVARQAHHASAAGNKKTLVFVRRVASVGELKAKIEESYNAWLADYLAHDAEVHAHVARYTALTSMHEHHRLDDGQENGDLGTFFSWFYRGENEALTLRPTPHNLRQTLLRGAMFEIDWSTLPGMPAPQALDWSRLSEVLTLPASPGAGQLAGRAQHAYLSCVAAGGSPAQQRVARHVLAVVFEHASLVPAGANPAAHAAELGKRGIWSTLRAHEALAPLALPWNEDIFDAVADDHDDAAADRATRLVRRYLVHANLCAALCRLDHPFVDLYALRHQRDGARDLSADEQMSAAFCDLLARQAASPGFSSFTVLRDLAAQLDMILKQNFEEIYHKKAGELPTYIANQLHPLSPVVGATGDNHKSRSAIARKFRMPGYPRVLVSTDVFQEGEDLHTFCDRVVHYGISASPIALEQKVGRVDRIASLAHRAMADAGQGYRDHFIQVGFPHIRESLEFLQVRAAAHNLNAFHRSLQRVEGSRAAPDSRIDLNAGLLDTDAIEAPIDTLLHSPFIIGADWLAGRAYPALREELDRLDARRRHCRALVGATLGRMAGAEPAPVQAAGAIGWTLEDGITVVLRGAQGNGQLILGASRPATRAFDHAAHTGHGLLAALAELQRNPAARLQLADDAMIANAEIYAGGAGILHASEVIDLHARLALADGLGGDADPALPARVRALVAGLCGNHGAYNVQQDATGRALDYRFALEPRGQRVEWTLCGGYVLVRAQVLAPQAALELAHHPAQLLGFTLGRNRRFDVVDFHIDDGLGLSVRALHPLAHLDHEELDFICHQVASNALRLRQVLANPANDNEHYDHDV
ncbi:DEAD/DEAH box helicase [Telluria beijingensis]|uniref:DEAD/DEAH box helicase n=1 Tax=Telluria beijingensis TaxID=3068633 RepID=UPI0027956992|nr:DEAD/DEAH box helicase [Massilia sp. REN29]